MATSKRTRSARMTGDERRTAIIRAATEIFARHTYRAATTASIARASGITEPVLYHHFGNKAALYSACLDAAWSDLRARWDHALAHEPDPARWMARLAFAGLAALGDEKAAGKLWLTVMTEVVDDDEARPRIVEFTRQLHEYITDTIERAQAAGGLSKNLDPRAEAWIFLSIGVLHSLSRRLDGLADADFEQVMASRQRWYAVA